MSEIYLEFYPLLLSIQALVYYVCVLVRYAKNGSDMCKVWGTFRAYFWWWAPSNWKQILHEFCSFELYQQGKNDQNQVWTLTKKNLNKFGICIVKMFCLISCHRSKICEDKTLATTTPVIFSLLIKLTFSFVYP